LAEKSQRVMQDSAQARSPKLRSQGKTKVELKKGIYESKNTMRVVTGGLKGEGFGMIKKIKKRIN